uniref:Uncharacterized protein n=1 Tax=uncultured marine virus TaxID=186617 RepID=A0A0F7L9Y1_9VIRU|nr:hypothetical protein [uncultured marine virus]
MRVQYTDLMQQLPEFLPSVFMLRKKRKTLLCFMTQMLVALISILILEQLEQLHRETLLT